MLSRPAAPDRVVATVKAGGASLAPNARVGLLASAVLPFALFSAGPATAAEAPAEIVIVGELIRTLPEPERTIRGDDLLGYGLGTIGQLLGEIAEEQGPGFPGSEVLVDGRLSRRASGVEDYPAEAVERIEILPPGSGGPLGGSRTGRVYNVVLKAQSRVLAVRAGHRLSTQGGWGSTSAEASATRIAKPRRLNLTLGATRETQLLESERRLGQPSEAPAGAADSRTLRPSRTQVDGSLALSDELTPWLRGALTVKLNRSRTFSRQGLSPSGDVLDQRRRAMLADASVLLEAEFGPWQVALDGAIAEQRRRTTTELAFDERASVLSTVRTRSVELTANGPLLALPAGSLRATVGIGANRDSLISTRNGERRDGSQTSREVRLAFDLPVASDSFVAAVGDLSVGAEFRRGRVSGSGRLRRDTMSARWQPARWLRMFASVSRSRTPPSVELLAETLIETPGVRYLDPVRNETVDVVALSGGNPQIGAGTTRETRLSAQLRPLPKLDLAFSADYVSTVSRNRTAPLPPASSAVLAAFPERFARDSLGALVRVDLRPISFEWVREDQLRYGMNLTLPLSGRARRMQFNAAHTVLLRSELAIGRGLEPIDLLSRNAIGLGGASRPRHLFEVMLGYAEPGLGARLMLERRTRSFLDNSGADRADLLRFEPLTTVGFRAFTEGSRLAPGTAWLRGSRLSLTVLNLANARERVRDQSGNTPLAFQPVYRDPLGRTIEVEFRKAF